MCAAKKKWIEFEEEACLYLNETYKHSSVTFQGDGGSNSTSSDINIFFKTKCLFSIEAKYSPSQSGQFVLEGDQHYVYSSKNKNKENIYTRQIITHLNQCKKIYTPKGQEAIKINLTSVILSDWIKSHYKRKKSFYIITSTKLNDYKALIHIDDLDKYFSVSASLRRKKSGSGYVSKSKLDYSLILLENHIKKLDIGIKKTTQEKIGSVTKNLVEFDENTKISSADKYFGNEFFLSENTEGDGYFIKKTSNTNNINVIFSLIYTGPQTNFGKIEFNDFIKNSINLAKQ